MNYSKHIIALIQLALTELKSLGAFGHVFLTTPVVEQCLMAYREHVLLGVRAPRSSTADVFLPRGYVMDAMLVEVCQSFLDETRLARHSSKEKHPAWDAADAVLSVLELAVESDNIPRQRGPRPNQMSSHKQTRHGNVRGAPSSDTSKTGSDGRGKGRVERGKRRPRQGT